MNETPESSLPSATHTEPGWRRAGLRYFKYSHFLAERFGKRVQRVTVDGGFTCPNADGTVAVGGCVYCDNQSFSPARRGPKLEIARQVEQGIAILDDRYEPDAYLAYFQAATNTYAPAKSLRMIYDRALSNPKIIGLIVGTRPDCVPDDVIDLLESYTDRYFVAVEYGLQSVHNRSLEWMNRGHDADCFFDAVERTKGRKIDISAHVILGLPDESREDMLQTIDAVATCCVDGVKIHNLHVVRDTPLEEQYAKGEIRLFERDEYIDLIIDVLDRLPQSMVIHRVTGDAPSNYLVAPRWPLQKAEFLQALEREMIHRNAFQGGGFTSSIAGAKSAGW